MTGVGLHDRFLKRDFGTYAKMEAFNVVLVPGLAIWFGWPRTWIEGLALASTLVAVAGLLIVGAIYWRAVDRRLKLRDRDGFFRAMRYADRAERPMVAVTAVGGITTIVAWVIAGTSWSVIVAAVATLLAVLEYVNYYHRQLQVFDNLPDLRRFVSTGRFKKAHLARDLAAFRSIRMSA